MKKLTTGLLMICALTSTSLLAKGGKSGGIRMLTPSFKPLGIQSSNIQIGSPGAAVAPGSPEGRIFFRVDERAEIDRKLAGKSAHRVVGEIEIGGTKRKIVVNADQ